MNAFREAFSQIRRQCESYEFRMNIEQMRNTFNGRALVLYGAGELGSRTANWLIKNGIHPDCFCDRGKNGIHSKTTLPIISPQDLLLQYEDANILICSVAHAESIQRDLITLGVPEDRIFLTKGLKIHEMTVEDFLPYVDGYEWAYNFFADDASKKVILQRVSGYLLSSPLQSSSGIEYFDREVMSLSSEEVFVDGGLFNGDTASDFMRFVEGQFKHYYGFEIDPENYRQAAINLTGVERVTLIRKGLWSREAELRFQANLSASTKLSESGDEIAHVTSLDTFFEEITDKPTLIKMDIEGAEKEALLGTEKIIKSVKPKLAICAYHKPEDIYELTKLLVEYDVGYRYTLRHYSNTLLDTVLYAV